MQEAKRHVKQMTKRKVKRSSKHVRGKNKKTDPSPTCRIREVEKHNSR
jgi:hypothetical protein